MKIINFLKNPLKIILWLDGHKLIRLSDVNKIKLDYRVNMQKTINLVKPVTFNEKLNWLKLNDRKDYYSSLVDKYKVKEIVAELIGEEYIIPTIGVYDKFDDIDFSLLPNSFVIKCTHDSGGIVICKDKTNFDVKKAKKKINKFLRRDFYNEHREWPYKNVERKIIVEKCINNTQFDDLCDYKFFCFNGCVEFFKIDFDRFIDHRANYYDRNCNLMEFGEYKCPPDFERKVVFPTRLKKMIELAEIISKNHVFLRVDFYEVDSKIYFGEITFYPSAGIGKIIPEIWDEKLGDMIII